MTGAQAQEAGFEHFEAPPLAANDLIRQAFSGEILAARCFECRTYGSGPGYLEMESNLWFCVPCVDAMPPPPRLFEEVTAP